jgi:DNA-binding SARP family transcriptional activator/tetratricopeptide (TPR) repeat protein
VSTLRKAIGAEGPRDVIITRAPGYQLDVPGETIDAVRFKGLVAAARAAADDGRLQDAITSLRTALSLWRGPAATGIDSHVVRIAATGLNEQRLAAQEMCIGLELKQGNHADVIAELAALVVEYPLRERFRAQQMLALHGVGRQADALAAFREARQVYIEELGLEPGGELVQLELDILNNEPSLNPVLEARTVPLTGPAHERKFIPRQLPTDIADFTGRRGVIEQLCNVLTTGEGAIRAGPVQVAVLTGMSGVGKTTLAVHVGHLLEDSFPDGQLFIQLGGRDGHKVSVDQVLEHCLRSVGVAPGALPSGTIELAEMYRSILAIRRVLVVLDDAGSLAQVMALMPGAANCAVIVTTKQRILNLPGVHLFEVGTLPRENAIELLSQVLWYSQAEDEDADVGTLAELCGFLPLALRVVAGKLLENPHWTVRQMVCRLMDEKKRLTELQIGNAGVMSSISVSYEGLTDGAKKLFLRLGLLGATDFASWVCAPLLDLEMEQVADLLDELVVCRLVDVQRVVGGSPRFDLHELIRTFAVGRLAAEQDVREQTDALHRLLGCWLFLVTEAHRRVYGGDFTVLHGSAEQWRFPSRIVADLLDSPLKWFHDEHHALISAIGKAAQIGLDELCWDLAATAVVHFEAESLFDDWRQTCEQALAAVRHAGNQRGEAALVCSLGELAYFQQRTGDASADLGWAWSVFDALHEVHGRALAASHLGFIERIQGHGEQALLRYDSAIRDLRQVGDQVAEAHALVGMAQVLLDQENYDNAELLLSKSLMLCAGSVSQRVEAQATYHLAEVYLGRGALKRAHKTFNSVLVMARANGDRTGEAYAMRGIGLVLTRLQRYDAAFAPLSVGLEISRILGNRMIEGQILLALSELSIAKGNTSVALGTLADAMNAFRLAGASAWQARVQKLTRAIVSPDAAESGGRMA